MYNDLMLAVEIGSCFGQGIVMYEATHVPMKHWTFETLYFLGLVFLPSFQTKIMGNNTVLLILKRKEKGPWSPLKAKDGGVVQQKQINQLTHILFLYMGSSFPQFVSPRVPEDTCRQKTIHLFFFLLQSLIFGSLNFEQKV